MADPPTLSAATRVAGVIGWPVEHSLSPAIHNAAFAALELDWVYVALPVAPDAMPAAVPGLRALGFAGANVTMPHKDAAADLADEVSEDARRLHAVNTLVVGEDVVVGENTDAPGFDRFLRGDAGFDPDGRHALVFGAGGGARACALAMCRAGLARLTVAVREPARATSMRASLEGLGTEIRIVDLGSAHSVSADLIVNATPVGTAGESLPLPSLGPHTMVIDLLTDPAVTPLVTSAREAGATAFGGVGLLVHQAALSFERWTGRVPPLDVMSAAAVAALAARR